MRNFIEAIWQYYTGMLRLVGSTILVLTGIALCGYAMTQQFEKIHSTGLDSAIFAAGISLVAFRVVRGFVWTAIGLFLPWAALVAGGIYLLADDFYRFRITANVILLGTIPPILAALLLEFRPKSAEEIQEEANEPHLEITINEPLSTDEVEGELEAGDAPARDGLRD